MKSYLRMACACLLLSACGSKYLSPGLDSYLLCEDDALEERSVAAAVEAFNTSLAESDREDFTVTAEAVLAATRTKIESIDTVALPHLTPSKEMWEVIASGTMPSRAKLAVEEQYDDGRVSYITIVHDCKPSSSSLDWAELHRTNTP